MTFVNVHMFAHDATVSIEEHIPGKPWLVTEEGEHRFLLDCGTYADLAAVADTIESYLADFAARVEG